ncbi:hypothetical protein [Nocardia crassostreae]|uniref:hypothetical protein n=1 Tax=Nocardia crassostreae TaxID=53428 RepID=UPI0008297BC9|nr:hypothetical protein [Nocardia crassostreae]
MSGGCGTPPGISRACRDTAIRNLRPRATPVADQAAAEAYEAEQAATEAAERKRRHQGAA